MYLKKQFIRFFFYSTLTVMLITLLPGLALSQAALDKVIKGAKKEGKLVVYASYNYDQGDVLHAAFKKKYPFVEEVEHLNIGGPNVVTRILMESQSGSPTADVGLTGGPFMPSLMKKGFLREIDWAALGAKPGSFASSYQITLATVTNCIAYNTKLVSPADAPKNWEDLLDPKWKGKIGLWRNPAGLTEAAGAWGKERTVNYLKALMKQDPIVVTGGGDVGTRLAAGEYSVCIIMYDAIFTAQRKGAPVKEVWPDPVPVERYDACLPKLGKNPNTAILYSLWCGTPEASALFEKLRGRGNAFIEGTPIADTLKGKQFGYWPMEKVEERAAVMKELRKIMGYKGRR